MLASLLGVFFNAMVAGMGGTLGSLVIVLIVCRGTKISIDAKPRENITVRTTTPPPTPKQ